MNDFPLQEEYQLKLNGIFSSNSKVNSEFKSNWTGLLAVDKIFGFTYKVNALESFSERP